MLNRLLIVLYVAAIGWAIFFTWGVVQNQSTIQWLAIAVFGLGPLGLLLLFRWITAGRLP